MNARDVRYCGLYLAFASVAQLGATAAQRGLSDATKERVGGGEVTAVTFQGFVLAPDGSPEEGAVVVTSAGGMAVTDAAGSYRLEAEVPLEATSVQITATSSAAGNPVAIASVALAARTRALRLDPLSLGASRSPRWLPTFGEQPGTDYTVSTLVTFDDGNGPAIYVGGDFTSAGNSRAKRVAKWDGSSWEKLGSGMDDSVLALAVYDDGGGPALYAGGDFIRAGSVDGANGIARWDGADWVALGTGMEHACCPSVRALAAYDDGSGPALYAGGRFTTAGGVPVSNIAKWDGSSWTALGSGIWGTVHCLVVYDDGSGPALHAGCAEQVARWNGSSWSELGQTTFYNRDVFTLAVYDAGGGAGPKLWAGGNFWEEGYIARYAGPWWTEIGLGMNDSVGSLAAHDDGSGQALYASGSFTSADGVPVNHIARRKGQSWSPVPGFEYFAGGFTGVRLAVCDDGSGSALHAGGRFFLAGGSPANNVAKWDGQSWSAYGDGLNSPIDALAVFDDGSGPALYAAGSPLIRKAGDEIANGIARWDGQNRSALGSGVLGVEALAVYDDGGGPALFAGGGFSVAGGVAANCIAQWDGQGWSALGSGLEAPLFPPHVLDLAAHDDGNGPALYAGGSFATAGGVAASRIARWDGSSWSSLGSGMTSSVRALTEFDEGSGPALYAGGDFSTAGGVAVNFIAKWDGASWSSLGNGMDDGVEDLATYDDGSGPALYAGGRFTTAGGMAANRIAMWDGASWSPLGTGLNNVVTALAVHDEGNGPVLYAGGYFTTAGGVAANRIAMWDGTSWSPLGSGMDLNVFALAGYDDGSGPALYAGGNFTNALDAGDSFLAKWGPLPVVKSKVRRR